MGGVKFDPTVNLGHLLSAGTVLVAITFGWAVLDSRQTHLEARTVRLEAARERDDRETMTAVGSLERLKAQMDAIQNSVRRIENLLDRPPQQGAPR